MDSEKEMKGYNDETSLNSGKEQIGLRDRTSLDSLKESDREYTNGSAKDSSKNYPTEMKYRDSSKQSVKDEISVGSSKESRDYVDSMASAKEEIKGTSCSFKIFFISNYVYFFPILFSKQ